MFFDKFQTAHATRILRSIGHPLVESGWITEPWQNYFGKSRLTYEKQGELQIRQKCPASGCECEFVIRENLYQDYFLVDVWDISKMKYTYDKALRMSCYVIGFTDVHLEREMTAPTSHVNDTTAWRKIDNKYLCSRLVGLL